MPPEDSRDQLDTLLHRIETVEDLQQQGMLTAEEAAGGIVGYLDQASAAAGGPVTRADLEASRALAETGFFAGWLELIDLVWAAVAVLLLVSLVWLTRIYVVPVIKRLPRWVHEGMAWAACLALVALPRVLLTGGGAVAVATVGCLGLVGAVLLTADIHLRRWKTEATFRGCCLLLCALWGGAALLHDSALIGGLAVFAWLWAAGAILLLDLTLFQRGEAVHVAMIAALTLLIPALAITLAQASPPAAVAVFLPGALALCGTVYLSGCLVLASRHYPQGQDRFFAMQVLAIGSAVAAVVLGTVAELSHLQEAGGSFFALYLLEKFFEIPWKQAGYAWMCLALSAVLYAGASLAEAHPGLFFGF